MTQTRPLGDRPRFGANPGALQFTVAIFVLSLVALPAGAVDGNQRDVGKTDPRPTGSAAEADRPPLEPFRQELRDYFARSAEFSPTVLGPIADDPELLAQIHRRIDELPADSLLELRGVLDETTGWELAPEILNAALPPEARAIVGQRADRALQRYEQEVQEAEAFRSEFEMLLALAQMAPDSELERWGVSRESLELLLTRLPQIPNARLLAARNELGENTEWQSASEGLERRIPGLLRSSARALATRGPLSEKDRDELERFRTETVGLLAVLEELPSETIEASERVRISEARSELLLAPPELLFALQQRMDRPAVTDAVEQIRALGPEGTLSAEAMQQVEERRDELLGLTSAMRAAAPGSPRLRAAQRQIERMSPEELAMAQRNPGFSRALADMRQAVFIVQVASSPRVQEELENATEQGIPSESIRAELIGDLTALGRAAEVDPGTASIALQSVEHASDTDLLVMREVFDAAPSAPAQDRLRNQLLVSELLATAEGARPTAGAFSDRSSSGGGPITNSATVCEGGTIVDEECKCPEGQFPDATNEDETEFKCYAEACDTFLGNVCLFLETVIGALVDNVIKPVITTVFEVVIPVVEAVIAPVLGPIIEAVFGLDSVDLTDPGSLFGALLRKLLDDSLGIPTSHTHWQTFVQNSPLSFFTDEDELLKDVPCPSAGEDIPFLGTVGTFGAAGKISGYIFAGEHIIELLPTNEWSMKIKIPVMTAFGAFQWLGECLNAAAEQNLRSAIVGDDTAIVDAAEYTDETGKQVGWLPRIKGRVDDVEDTVISKARELMMQISSFEALMVQLKIEHNLLATARGNDPIALFQSPEEDGGLLEVVRDIVELTILRLEDAGLSTNNARLWFRRGNAKYMEDDFKTAYSNYARAYWEAVKNTGAPS